MGNLVEVALAAYEKRLEETLKRREAVEIKQYENTRALLEQLGVDVSDSIRKHSECIIDGYAFCTDENDNLFCSVSAPGDPVLYSKRRVGTLADIGGYINDYQDTLPEANE